MMTEGARRARRATMPPERTGSSELDALARELGAALGIDHKRDIQAAARALPSVLGRARRLLTSFDARPGDDLVVAVDLRGRMHARHAFWNASDDAPPARLRADYALLPRIAEEGMAVAAKDVSMGGIAGTALMLC